MNLPVENSPIALDSGSMPWIPLGPGESFKPLRFFPNGRALLLRLEPGTLVPRHRHEGEVHAFNVSGSRKLIESGEIAGPGAYVYEPAGNVDSWMAPATSPSSSTSSRSERWSTSTITTALSAATDLRVSGTSSAA